MKTPNFLIALGILCIVDDISPVNITGITPPPGEDNYAFCNQTVDCFEQFAPPGVLFRGLCVNLKTINMKNMKKIIDINVKPLQKPCNGKTVDQPNNCVKCFKNKCKQSKLCNNMGGICRFETGNIGLLGGFGCKSKKGCKCYSMGPPPTHHSTTPPPY